MIGILISIERLQILQNLSGHVLGGQSSPTMKVPRSPPPRYPKASSILGRVARFRA